MLDKKNKQKIINKFRIHDKDTGSPQVQIAILSEEVKELTEHLKEHKHDHSSRRGLLKKVGERRKLLKYLQKEDEQAFSDLAKKLNLRIAKKMIEEEKKKEELNKVIEEDTNEDEEEETEDEKDKNETEE